MQYLRKFSFFFPLPRIDVNIIDALYITGEILYIIAGLGILLFFFCLRNFSNKNLTGICNFSLQLLSQLEKTKLIKIAPIQNRGGFRTLFGKGKVENLFKLLTFVPFFLNHLHKNSVKKANISNSFTYVWRGNFLFLWIRHWLKNKILDYLAVHHLHWTTNIYPLVRRETVLKSFSFTFRTAFALPGEGEEK